MEQHPWKDERAYMFRHAQLEPQRSDEYHKTQAEGGSIRVVLPNNIKAGTCHVLPHERLFELQSGDEKTFGNN